MGYHQTVLSPVLGSGREGVRALLPSGRGQCARDLDDRLAAAQWNILAKITAITGARHAAVTDEHFDTARTAMTLAYTRRGHPARARTWPRSSTACG